VTVAVKERQERTVIEGRSALFDPGEPQLSVVVGESLLKEAYAQLQRLPAGADTSGLPDRFSRPSCRHQAENSPESFRSDRLLSVSSGPRKVKIFLTAGSIVPATKTA
jgi:hypothetical protein